MPTNHRYRQDRRGDRDQHHRTCRWPRTITLTFDANAGARVPSFIVAGGPGATPIAYDPATESAGKSFTFVGYGEHDIHGLRRAAGRRRLRDLEQHRRRQRQSATAWRCAGAARSVAARQRRPPVTKPATANWWPMSAPGPAAPRSTRDAQQALLNRVTAERESVSGVNLDEEAANMMRYQQAYEAAAQMIAVSDTLFQTLLAAVRR
ncbi:MAG: hypothetical protein MZV65_52120 [Chromatiales bacterium]|nr:hypothetical protein [Chromatiales bacterium]